MAEEYAPKSPDLSSFFSAPAAPPTPPQQHPQHHYDVPTQNLNGLPNHYHRRHNNHEHARTQFPVSPHREPIHYPLSGYQHATTTAPDTASSGIAAPIKQEQPHHRPFAVDSEYRQEPAHAFAATQPHIARQQQQVDRHPQESPRALHSEQPWPSTLQNFPIQGSYDRRASHPPYSHSLSARQGQPGVVPGTSTNQLPHAAAASYNQIHGHGQYQAGILHHQQLQSHQYQPPPLPPQQHHHQQHHLPQQQQQQQKDQEQQRHQAPYYQPQPTPGGGSENMPPRRTAVASATSSESTIEPSPVKTKFPTARIKRIMQADEEVGKVAQQTPIAVGKALELFMIHVVTKSADIAREKNSKRVTAHMLKQVIENDGQYDFLADIAAKIGDDEKRGGRTNSNAKAETEESEEDFVEAEPKKRGRGGRKKKGVA